MLETPRVIDVNLGKGDDQQPPSRFCDAPLAVGTVGVSLDSRGLERNRGPRRERHHNRTRMPKEKSAKTTPYFKIQHDE